MAMLHMVHTKPMPSKEKELNEWYEGYVREVVDFGGFRSGRRAVIDIENTFVTIYRTASDYQAASKK